jgi:hypothetical protein
MAAVLVAGIAACGGGSPAGVGPEAVVADALAKTAAKDLDGLSSLACAGQEDRIREQLSGMSSLDSGLLPGLDAQAMLDAVEMDTSEVKVGQPTINGDAADVPVSGSLGISFDKEKMRPILKQVLEQQGQTLPDDQLDAMLGMLETYAQDVPFDESVHLVREDGAWKICDAG